MVGSECVFVCGIFVWVWVVENGDGGCVEEILIGVEMMKYIKAWVVVGWLLIFGIFILGAFWYQCKLDVWQGEKQLNDANLKINRITHKKPKVKEIILDSAKLKSMD